MATEQQLLKLEAIQTKINRAKEQGKDIATELSEGRIGYKKALNSVMTVGAWATITPMVAAAVIILRFVVPFLTIYAWAPKNYEIYLSVGALVACLVSGILGYKLWSLDATPLFTLVSLVIILICNSLLFIGVLPVITAILAIVALVRFSTFCSWFNHIKV